MYFGAFPAGRNNPSRAAATPRPRAAHPMMATGRPAAWRASLVACCLACCATARGLVLPRLSLLLQSDLSTKYVSQGCHESKRLSLQQRSQLTRLCCKAADGTDASTWYFTCRHTYEETLVAELERAGAQAQQTDFPGLVQATIDNYDCSSTSALETALRSLDPAYALQVLPNALQIPASSGSALVAGVVPFLEARMSWKASPPAIQVGFWHCLFPGVLQTVQAPGGSLRPEYAELEAAPRGALAVHSIVPQQLKGTPKPKMVRSSVSTLLPMHKCEESAASLA
eukprot:6200882-Pleurochrysis_carterae.AAC.4